MARLVGGWLAAIVFLLSAFGTADAADPPPLSVPILLFHRLGPSSPDEMTVTTPVFETQLKTIQDRGYKVIPLKQLMAAYNDPAVELPPRAVVIVADDGHRSVYTDMFPLLKRYQIPVTLFIYPSAISNTNYTMTWEQLEEMKASGLADIQSHTFWHPNFNIDRKKLGPPAFEKFAKDQLERPKAILEKRFGGKIDLIAWPFGIHDSELEKWAQEAGYVEAFTIERRPVTRKDKPMALPRFIVTDFDRGSRFENLLATSK